MLGIKTKKDKRIEQLENMLFATKLQTPMPVRIDKNIVALGASVVLEDLMPVEYAKELITRNMAEKIKDQIFYDVEDREGLRVLHGYLRIVVER